MKIFAPKRTQVLTSGRVEHFLFGVMVTLATAGTAISLFHSSAYAGAIVGILITTIAGFLWELSTPLLAKWMRWEHPFGDMVDFIAYILGAIAIAIWVWRIGG